MATLLIRSERSRPLSRSLVAGLFVCSIGVPLPAQTATIKEEVQVLETYPFSDPDPSPILLRDPRLYPYHGFDGYSHESEPRPWKVVTLENEYIEVFVLPEVGGKVWGARIVATGEEFIYRNEVMKFRNIALRGPWTSGGIEFNFGVIGHSPATATPVDYVLQQEPDGGVSCTVGSIDLPSRTPWRVKILLPADSACFETQVLWYNPTSLEQPYYNWMTGAAFVRDDLEFFVPGDKYLKHSGEAKRWPFDGEKRQLSLYDANRFGGHKSYHVVGEYNDFFGGYYHDAGFGFGHWAPYEEMPGQKLWLWALSREGGVWEELLTDTDGQYIEFQAGRLFVQYATGGHQNPIREAVFEPHRVDRWTERWFPLKGIGGVTAASATGAMNVEREGGALRVRLHSFVPGNCTMNVEVGGERRLEKNRELAPLEVWEEVLPIPAGEPWSISVPELDLLEEFGSEPLELQRPFATDPLGPAAMTETERTLGAARELARARRYGAAIEELEAILTEEPWHRDALPALAEHEYRRGRYKEGLEAVNRALQRDTYDPRANWIAGALHRSFQRDSYDPLRNLTAGALNRARGHLVNAKECFGWAARSMAYRAAAYTELAEIALLESDWVRAERRARQALDYDRYSIEALEVKAIAERWQLKRTEARATLDRILELDPLHHFVYLEEYLLEGSEHPPHRLRERIGGELPDQTWLELGISYANRGQVREVIHVLDQRAYQGVPLIDLWRAYIFRDWHPEYSDPSLEEALKQSPAFVFPFRRETLPVLEWARTKSEDWKLDYYLALNLWALDRAEEAARLLEGVGDEPDFAPFYTTRAHLQHQIDGRDPEADLRRAAELDPERWHPTKRLIDHLQGEQRWEDAEALARETRSKFPDNFQLELTHARALLELGALDECAEILEAVKVLPSEMGRVGRQLFEQAYVARAIERIRAKDLAGAEQDVRRSLEWPEHLGVGKPYEPEERLQRFLLSYCLLRQGEVESAAEQQRALHDGWGDDPGGTLLLLSIASQAMYSGGPTPLSSLWKPIRSSSEVRDPERAWIDTVIANDVEAIQKLEAEHPQRFATMNCRLLREAFEVTVGDRR